MHAKMFYDISVEKAVPLSFINKTQWEQGLGHLTPAEQNYFLTQQFKAKAGDICFIYDNDGLPGKVYVGSGDDNRELALANVASRLPPGCYFTEEALSQSAMVVWALAQYRFIDYKKQELLPRKLVIKEERLSAVTEEVAAVFLVRDLINKPTNDLGPEELAEVVANLAKAHGAEFEQWVGNALLESNFPAIHAVGRASINEPRLLSLTWGDKRDPKITLVGKGVCFDSGGLDIKPSTAMRLMKKDMGGAAHAIGLAQWIMACQLPVRLQVLIPAVENSIGPDAFRPGDILTMRNGLTVEVDNTDAEGRLVLADAIVKACEDKPELLIDFSTLTGAARVAVGTEIAAMFSNDDTLANALAKSSSAVNDPIWRLPLFGGYENMLESSIADLVNASASPYAGAITAALFLQRFIPGSIPWVHFDIMAWNTSSKPGKPEGGEAMSLRAITHYLLKTYGKH
ncbi:MULTISPECIES: M17 family metallopeptidase [unclassified Legionella]|uniref:leucyl aminopeptidase family protein n=1 Tax=unclassified Legionella TaxID=2622702 RepID=UPI00105439A8|nr:MULTISPECIES: leucyl aminopeptidase family protein [unclassified Legionella]MDI9819103.1 leucyl aminopeptidase family protein [Legionella sp. PL877]